MLGSTNNKPSKYLSRDFSRYFGSHGNNNLGTSCAGAFAPEGGAVTNTETGSGLSGDADANSNGGTLILHVVERRANYLLKTLLFPLWDTQKNL